MNVHGGAACGGGGVSLGERRGPAPGRDGCGSCEHRHELECGSAAFECDAMSLSFRAPSPISMGASRGCVCRVAGTGTHVCNELLCVPRYSLLAPWWAPEPQRRVLACGLRAIIGALRAARAAERENDATSQKVRVAVSMAELSGGNIRLCLKQMSRELLVFDHLASTFIESVGLSFRQYLVNLRIAHAAQLLLTTDFAVARIGTVVGHSDPSNFVREFTASVASSPSNSAFFRPNLGSSHRMDWTTFYAERKFDIRCWLATQSVSQVPAERMDSILLARDRKVEEARQRRQQRREQAV